MDAIQCKMARAALGWSARDLAQRANVGLATVQRFEAGQAKTIYTIIHMMKRALEDAGITFLAPGQMKDGGQGVRLRPFKVGDTVVLIENTPVWADPDMEDIRYEPALLVEFVDDGTSMKRITVRYLSGRELVGMPLGLFKRY